MKSVNFCFATHNHQPIGNFDYVFEDAYQKSYLPFFRLLEKHKLRISTHFSGILLQWIAEEHPEHIQLLRSLVSRSQLEMISGGYYEPILSVFSPKDGELQIKKLSEYIKYLFETKPKGLWLAERVWEPQLPSLLSSAQMKYTILDDTHFRGAGLSENDLSGYYMTEDQGKRVAVFPISKALRYTIPFASVDETLRVLRDSTSEAGNRIVTFADDGEKFGVWPKTFDHVYGEGWLEEFFTKIEENDAWLKTIHFSEAIETIKPVGTIYLPTSSYSEMMEWSLPKSEAALRYEVFTKKLSHDEDEWKKNQQFVRGGFWRNFFAKYPESDHLHKRVLGVSNRLHALPDELKHSVIYTQALDNLLAAECNDSYWHGVFGGIYLANLRHEVYSKLICAENELWILENAGALTLRQLNELGSSYYSIENANLRIIIEAKDSCSIREIDFKPASFNISNFINRIPEPSHEKLKMLGEPQDADTSAASIHERILTKEKDLERYLIYDSYRHGSFIEHFFDPKCTIDDMKNMRLLEQVEFGDVDESAQLAESANRITIHQSRIGIHRDGKTESTLRLGKTLTIERDANVVGVKYYIQNESNNILRLRFGSEWTFGLLAGDAHDRYFDSPDAKLRSKKLNSSGEIRGAKSFALVDEWSGFKIALESPIPTTFWRTPIETVSLSEEGFERVYQGSIIFALWDISLEPKEGRDVAIDIRVSTL
ncbi:MAG: alpha-amylase/4-alpha-glucanotransferase domain-containing protein [bacterium]